MDSLNLRINGFDLKLEFPKDSPVKILDTSAWPCPKQPRS